MVTDATVGRPDSVSNPIRSESVLSNGPPPYQILADDEEGVSVANTPFTANIYPRNSKANNQGRRSRLSNAMSNDTTLTEDDEGKRVINSQVRTWAA